MTIKELRQVHSRTPFRPFRLHLTNGETVVVRHRETMSMPESNDPETGLFVVWDARGWNFIEIAQVARISAARTNGLRTKH